MATASAARPARPIQAAVSAIASAKSLVISPPVTQMPASTTATTTGTARMRTAMGRSRAAAPFVTRSEPQSPRQPLDLLRPLGVIGLRAGAGLGAPGGD